MDERRKQKESFVFYFDWMDHLSLLEPSEALGVLNNLRDYITTGEVHQELSSAAKMAFSFIKSQVDRDLAKWETIRKKRSEAGKAGAEATNSRWQDSANSANAAFDESSPANSAVNVPVPVPVPVNVPVPDSVCNDKADKPPRTASKPERHKFGQYGWVKLSNDEYNRLSNDLGENEVKRCITYLDESAQSTGNKNKWRDWNLVIRRCSRDRWGIQQDKGGATTDTRNKVKRAEDYTTEGAFI